MDVGLQGAPNMEALAALAPQLIVIQAWQQQQRPRLERCAPVESLTIFTGTGDAYAHASDATRHMGEPLGCPERGMALIAACDATLAACRAQLGAHNGRPLCLAQVIDRNVVSLFSAGGLYPSVLDRLGLVNAWRGAPNLLWGGTRVGIERLTQVPEARLVLIGPAASA
ncbi:ABC transporter substrate-binding protein [Xanthobacter autotrophicus]|uniref:ABC transporter substrate-binding protein n=1 Tax=Xanthobacter autotrophicus TaxID=280 RepID=UPI00372CB698